MALNLLYNTCPIDVNGKFPLILQNRCGLLMFKLPLKLIVNNFTCGHTKNHNLGTSELNLYLKPILPKVLVILSNESAELSGFFPLSFFPGCYFYLGTVHFCYFIYTMFGAITAIELCQVSSALDCYALSLLLGL